MPVTSSTDICNLALGHLGEKSITSLNESSAGARACALYYESTRQEVLRSHRWNFAQDRKVLAKLTDRPVFGWKFAYQLPANCLRVVEMNGTEAGDILSEPYIIEGRKLLTNSEEVRLVYVYDISNVSDFDSLFVEAFALKLAVKLTEKIRGTTGKTEALLQAYSNAVAPLARRVDANEGRRRKGLLPVNSHALRARGVGTGALYDNFSQSGGLGTPIATEETTDDEEDTTEVDTRTMPLVLFGEAILNQVFGAYKPSEVIEITAIEITAQEVPIGAPLTIQLIDAFDLEIGAPVSLPSLAEHVRSVLAVPQSIEADTTIRAKVTAVGSTFAGSGVVVNLTLTIS
jgi:hypothetical protein